MNNRNLVPVLICAALMLAAAFPATAGIRNYRATFDVSFQEVGGMVTVAAQPILEIHNPPENMGGMPMTVLAVDISWNPRVSSTTVVDGITRHSNSQSCPVIAQVAENLAAGEGLSFNGVDVIESNCRPISACAGKRCSRSMPCPGPCHCIFRWPFDEGFCIDLVTPALGLPDRITFEVTIDDAENIAPPVVRVTDFIVENPTDPDLMTLKGVKGGEIDADVVQ